MVRRRRRTSFRSPWKSRRRGRSGGRPPQASDRRRGHRRGRPKGVLGKSRLDGKLSRTCAGARCSCIRACCPKSPRCSTLPSAGQLPLGSDRFTLPSSPLSRRLSKMWLFEFSRCRDDMRQCHVASLIFAGDDQTLATLRPRQADQRIRICSAEFGL